jgi:hypothetical protein
VPGSLGAAVIGELCHLRESRLQLAQAGSRAGVEHDPQSAQVGVREARVVEHPQPDRLEGGNRVGATVALELIDRDARVEVAAVDVRRARRQARHQRRERAVVEERQRAPEGVTG